MSLIPVTVGNLKLIEGPRAAALLTSADDITSVVEACFAARTLRALLYAENLPDAFFDLSSRQAGEMLQKLRNYGVRLAVVATPDATMSRRFGEMLAEERMGRAFGMFETRAAALEWLGKD